MVATPLDPTVRYYPVGTRQVYWVPSIADKTAPSRPELDGGIDLGPELSAMAGFDPTAGTIDVPDLASPFTSQIDGAITVSASTITIYLSESSQDIRQVLPRGTNGNVVIFWEGDVPGKTMDVFPARVISLVKDTTITDPGQCTITYAITSEPAENVTVPAA